LGLAYRNFFPVYGTIAIIAIAHTITWIAYGTRTTNGVMIQVHRELEEAGKVSGASTPRVLGRIVLPLVAAGIFNSWIWISMLSYREVTMALALGTRKNLVVSTIVWQFWGNGWVPQVAALGVLLGPSGCGKTTTLRCVAGLEKPDAGELEIAGTIANSPTRRIYVPTEKRDIGMVFQSYAIWPHMNVFQNVAFPLIRGRKQIAKDLVAEKVRH